MVITIIHPSTLPSLVNFVDNKIIPCLDTTFDESGKAVVVKGIEFESLWYAGDPVELARRYAMAESR